MGSDERLLKVIRDSLKGALQDPQLHEATLNGALRGLKEHLAVPFRVGPLRLGGESDGSTLPDVKALLEALSFNSRFEGLSFKSRSASANETLAPNELDPEVTIADAFAQCQQDAR